MKRRIFFNGSIDSKRPRITDHEYTTMEFTFAPHLKHSDHHVSSIDNGVHSSFLDCDDENNNMDIDDQTPTCISCHKVRETLPHPDADPLCKRCVNVNYCDMSHAKSHYFLSDRHIQHLRRFKPSSHYPTIYVLQSDVEKVALKIHRSVHWSVFAEFQYNRRNEYLRNATSWREVDTLMNEFDNIDPYAFVEEYMRVHPPTQNQSFFLAP